MNSGDEAAWRALSTRAIWRWRIHILVAGLAVALVLFGVTVLAVGDGVLSARAGTALLALFAGLVLAFAGVWPVLQHRRWRYRLAADALELERGVVVRRRSVVPYPRVQQIDINRSLVDRILGLAVAKLLTAAAGTDGRLPGLTPDDAEHFRTTVLARTGRHDAV